MSGHNKWSSIKHKKGKQDAKRGKIFNKIIRELIVAARDGGGNPEMNPPLRTAITKANAANMPKDNIQRAIKKGTGELEGINYEKYIYEGYGPGGVALLIETLTDNRQRTVAEIRHILTKNNGNLADKGAVAWNFYQVGSIMVPSNEYSEDELMMKALDCGADDFVTEDDYYIISTEAKKLHDVELALEKENIKIEDAQLVYYPRNTIKANEKAEKIIKLIEELEDLDDVQNVYANFEIDDEILEKVTSE